MTDDKTPTEPAAEPSVPAHEHTYRHGGVYALLSLLFVLQLGLAAAFYWLWQQPTSIANGTHNESWIAALEGTLAEQETEIASLRKSLKALGELNGTTESFNLQQETLAELDARLSTVEENTKKIAEEGKQSTAPITEWQLAKMAELSTDLQAMQTQIETKGSARWRFIQQLTAFDRLEERIEDHAPYAQALAAFELSLKDQDAKDKWTSILARSQHEGIASWESLSAQFESARDAATQSSAQASEPNFWNSVRDNLSALVKIRKSGPNHGGDDIESVLARAAYNLSQQDSESTLSELEHLPADSRAYFNDFTTSILQREAVLNLLPDIRNHLQAQLEASE